ncbi:uncharacterized protein EDB91DRAFT_1008701, partial [Suillus paluster]|uniref:uncharacterized protein n=1 Tax=Suillus paluster TaxID=48578 RepID=UPI001B87DFEB
SSTKLGEDFLHVLKLTVDRENWMTYKDRLSWSVDARGFLGHLKGTEKKPVDPLTLSGRGALELAAYKVTLKEWHMGKAIMKQQIDSIIPDSLFIQVKNWVTAGEIHLEKHSRVVSVKL